MSLTLVKVSEDVWLTCLTHALSTEKEEVMGLLLGDIEVSPDGDVTALIWGASPQKRCDRQKDRVETNPEQLAAASAKADRMTSAIGRMTRVTGWYHSHPHITVLPSHVDVRTQAMYQLLDSAFVGLIFSCFNQDSRKVGRIQAVAFQSVASVAVDDDPSSGARYARREIPVVVQPTATLDSPMDCFVDLQRMLYEEEREAYNQSLLLSSSHPGGDDKAAVTVHPSILVHHTSTYQASLCKLMEYCLSPAISVLKARLKEHRMRLVMMMSESEPKSSG